MLHLTPNQLELGWEWEIWCHVVFSLHIKIFTLAASTGNRRRYSHIAPDLLGRLWNCNLAATVKNNSWAPVGHVVCLCTQLASLRLQSRLYPWLGMPKAARLAEADVVTSSVAAVAAAWCGAKRSATPGELIRNVLTQRRYTNEIISNVKNKHGRIIRIKSRVVKAWLRPKAISEGPDGVFAVDIANADSAVVTKHTVPGNYRYYRELICHRPLVTLKQKKV